MAQDQDDAQATRDDEQESSETGQKPSQKPSRGGQSKSSGSSSSSSTRRSKRSPSKKSQSSESQSSQETEEDRGESAEPPKQMRGQELVAQAKSLVHELTGRRPESVSGLERAGDGWRVTFEFLELSRVPPTTDVLGTYHLELTEDGEVAGLHRSRRYLRNQPEGGEEGA